MALYDSRISARLPGPRGFTTGDSPLGDADKGVALDGPDVGVEPPAADCEESVVCEVPAAAALSAAAGVDRLPEEDVAAVLLAVVLGEDRCGQTR